MRTADDVIGGLVAELGGSLGVLLIALGNRCGLWRRSKGRGPLAPAASLSRDALARAGGR